MKPDYAPHLIAMRQELNHLEEAILHEKKDRIPQILKNINIERDLLEFWYWKQKNIDNQKVKP